MAERVRRSNLVPHGPAAMLDLLASADVVRARGDADGMGTRLLSHEVTEDDDGRVIRILTATDIPLDWLPGAIRSRLGAAPRVERTEAWSLARGQARTPLEFSFSGAPVSGSGSSLLLPEAIGSRLDTELVIQVDIPLLGALVEGAMGPRLGAALDAESRFYAALPPPGTVTA